MNKYISYSYSDIINSEDILSFCNLFFGEDVCDIYSEKISNIIVDIISLDNSPFKFDLFIFFKPESNLFSEKLLFEFGTAFSNHFKINLVTDDPCAQKEKKSPYIHVLIKPNSKIYSILELDSNDNFDYEIISEYKR